MPEIDPETKQVIDSYRRKDPPERTIEDALRKERDAAHAKLAAIAAIIDCATDDVSFNGQPHGGTFPKGKLYVYDLSDAWHEVAPQIDHPPVAEERDGD